MTRSGWKRYKSHVSGQTVGDLDIGCSEILLRRDSHSRLLGVEREFKPAIEQLPCGMPRDDAVQVGGSRVEREGHVNIVSITKTKSEVPLKPQKRQHRRRSHHDENPGWSGFDRSCSFRRPRHAQRGIIVADNGISGNTWALVSGVNYDDPSGRCFL